MAQDLLSSDGYDGGYYPNIFLDQEKNSLKHFLCSLCKRVCRDAVLTGCKNLDFGCEKCLRHYIELNKEKIKCPECQDIIDKKETNTLCLYPFVRIRNIILELWIRCEYCKKEEIQLKDYIKHCKESCLGRRIKRLSSIGGQYKEGERVRVLPKNYNLWIEGEILKVITEDLYLVRWQDYDNSKETMIETEEEVPVTNIKYPRVEIAKENATIKVDETEDSDMLEILLDGRNGEELNIYQCLCGILCKFYSDVLSDHDDWEEYQIDKGVYTASLIGINVIEFLSVPKFRWKIDCLFCIPEDMKKYGSAMIRNTIHRNLIEWSLSKDHQEIDCSYNWIPSTTGMVTLSCDSCGTVLRENEYEFRCSMLKHDLCLPCFQSVVRSHKKIYTLLLNLLHSRLNDDCIFILTCFVTGNVFQYTT